MPRHCVLALLLLLVARPGILTAQTPPPESSPPRIQDNSFLLEEAYNQEAGVVQHISAFVRGEGGWAYAFTQEWPLRGQRHQLSVSLPFQSIARDGHDSRGVGDVAINYRYQLRGDGDARLAISPRLSLLLPTGSSDEELGAGATGAQVNVPVSAVLSDSWVTHWNAGVTYTPNTKNALDERADTTSYNLGHSTIWQISPVVNVLLEIAYSSFESVTAPDSTEREHNLLLSPGVRWAHNLRNGLQIVPGVAVPVGVGPSRGDQALFLYLSFEHPFRATR